MMTSFRATTGNVQGPMTDYAINVTLNAGAYPTGSCGGGGGTYMKGKVRTIQGISDGTSNTMLVGTKYVQLSQYGNTVGNSPDEGILMGSANTSTYGMGTGRWGTLSNAPNGTAYPGYLQDATFTVGDYWGGPYPGGSPHLFGDGTVRTVNYSVDRTQFRYMLDPADGQTVNID